MSPSGSGSTQITDESFTCPDGCDPLSDLDPTFSPSGKRIAFVQYFPGGPYGDEDAGAIFLVHADGTHRHALTRRLVALRAPAFSPDGKRIAFDSEDGIHLMRADGTHDHRLTGRAANPVFFPSGKRIAFERPGAIAPLLFTVRVDGTHRHLLSNHPGGNPDISPDGRTIVFESGGSVFGMRADGTHARQLAAAGGAPVFSPNGRKIAFTGPSPDNSFAIAVMNADGSDQHVVTPSPSPFGSPDAGSGYPSSWGPRP